MGAARPTGVPPKQSLGQNFLIDDNIARNIVRSLGLQREDVLIEIGPGHGALTAYLAGIPRQLLAVEIDKRILGELREKFSSRGVTVIHDDFLNLQLDGLASEYRARLRIVGNIPYHVTSPILFKVFDAYKSVLDLTIMVQREVARRIVAAPGTKEYGILSVFSALYAEAVILFDVSRNCFYPKPNVTSSVLRLSLRKELPRGTDEKLFRTLVKTTFGKRRKTLRKSLEYLPFASDSGALAHGFAETLRGSPLDLERRPETLSVDEFLLLARHIAATLPWPKNR